MNTLYKRGYNPITRRDNAMHTYTTDNITLTTREDTKHIQ